MEKAQLQEEEKKKQNSAALDEEILREYQELEALDHQLNSGLANANLSVHDQKRNVRLCGNHSLPDRKTKEDR